MAAILAAKRLNPQSLNLKEQVVAINRVTKVVKGGKNLSFSALIVIGDPEAKVVGFGMGKAREVPAAIKKGIEAAKRNLRKVNVLATTIHHPVLGRFGISLASVLQQEPEHSGRHVPVDRREAGIEPRRVERLQPHQLGIERAAPLSRERVLGIDPAIGYLLRINAHSSARSGHWHCPPLSSSQMHSIRPPSERVFHLRIIG